MATHTRKALKVEDIQAKHFIAWLRKAIRNGGRHTSVGFVGDHYNNPVELYLQELTGERVFTQSCEPFSIGNEEYYFSGAFSGFSICVLEGDVDALPECGYSEVTAWSMLNTVTGFMDEDAYLVERPEVAQQAEGGSTMKSAHRTNKDRYLQQAQDQIVIDMDGDQLIALVPSQHDVEKQYRVEIEERTPTLLVATSCECHHCVYSLEHRCKHMVAVDLFYFNLFCKAKHMLYKQTSSYNVVREAQAIAADAATGNVYDELAQDKVLVRDEPTGSRLEALGWMRGKQGGILNGNVNA